MSTPRRADTPWRLVGRSARGVLLALALASGMAQAQPTASQSAAESLFQEGRQLLIDGKTAEACPKLAESLRLDPGDGTRLLLAQCYERASRTASAWLLYTEVADTSRQNNRADYLRAATERLERLTPRLSKIVLRVPERTAALEGFELRLDGALLGAAVSGVPIPIDPGEHTVQVSARGHQTVTLTARHESPGAPVTIHLPELIPTPPASSAPVASSAPPPPAPEPPKSPPPPPPRVRPWQPTAGYVTAGLGAVSALVGAYFLQQSLQKNGEASDRCPDTACPDRDAVSLSQQAVRSGNLATAFLGGGLVLLGTGVTLVLTAPGAPSPALPTQGMISWTGRF